MNDEILMGVLHGGANDTKELQPRLNRQVVMIAILINRLAFDVLHYEIGQAFFGRAAVK